jgi:hypothetical protein
VRPPVTIELGGRRKAIALRLEAGVAEGLRKLALERVGQLTGGPRAPLPSGLGVDSQSEHVGRHRSPAVVDGPPND